MLCHKLFCIAVFKEILHWKAVCDVKLTNRFHVAVRLFSNRSRMTYVLTTFDVFCDVLLNRRTATWNLFVLYNKELNFIICPLIDDKQEPIKIRKQS